MQLSEVLKAKSGQKWVNPNSEDASFRIHFRNVDGFEEIDLDFFLFELESMMGLRNLYQFASAAGPSRKFKDAWVMGFCLGTADCAELVEHFVEHEYLLARHGVLCVETGEEQLLPSFIAAGLVQMECSINAPTIN